MKQTLVRTSLVALVGLMFATAVVDAQQEDRQRQGQGQRQRRGGFRGGGGFGGFRGGGGVDLMALTRVEEVQKEIEMLDDQIADVRKLSEEQRAGRQRGAGRPGGGDRGGNRGARPNFGDLSDEERRELFENMRKQREEQVKQTESKLAEILLPHQLDRLREIQIQQLGAGALQRPNVVAKLGITEAQKKELEEVNAANGEEMRAQGRELFQGGGGNQRGNFEEIREKMAEMRTEATKKVMAVLTDDQRTKFEEMKGEPFAMPEGALRRGRGRGGPGGPGGRGGRPGRPERPARPEA